MRNLITLSPALIFFASYYAARTYPDHAALALSYMNLPGTGAFYAATVALIISAILQIILLLSLRMHITAGEWTGAALIIVFGGVTLMLRETAYLQIKTTVINWLFALAALGGELFLKKPAAEMLLGKVFEAPRTVWRRASIGLSAIFATVGAVNLVVISFFSEETWVWLKTFAYPALTFLGIAGVLIYVARSGEFRHETG